MNGFDTDIAMQAMSCGCEASNPQPGMRLWLQKLLVKPSKVKCAIPG